jgi:hypothetical protein
MEPMHQLQILDDGCYRVSLSDGRYSVSCTVSSMHLVEDKQQQLVRALQAMQQQQQG